MNIPFFTSSGGVGDALVAGTKILNKFGENVRWHHFERHACHNKALADLMQAFGFSEVNHRICEMPYTEATTLVNRQRLIPAIDQYDPTGGYVSSCCRTMERPFLDKPLYTIEQLVPWDSICVQMVAGRLHDNTRRTVGAAALKLIRQVFPSKYIIVVGPEKNEWIEGCVENGLINLTGMTDSIVDALRVVNSCAGFIGHDGVLAYYAMMRRKPTIVSYHAPELAEHYWHDEWSTHGLRILGNNIMCLGRAELHQLAKMIEG